MAEQAASIALALRMRHLGGWPGVGKPAVRGSASGAAAPEPSVLAGAPPARLAPSHISGVLLGGALTLGLAAGLPAAVPRASARSACVVGPETWVLVLLLELPLCSVLLPLLCLRPLGHDVGDGDESGTDLVSRTMSPAPRSSTPAAGLVRVSGPGPAWAGGTAEGKSKSPWPCDASSVSGSVIRSTGSRLWRQKLAKLARGGWESCDPRRAFASKPQGSSAIVNSRLDTQEAVEPLRVPPLPLPFGGRPTRMLLLVCRALPPRMLRRAVGLLLLRLLLDVGA